MEGYGVLIPVSLSKFYVIVGVMVLSWKAMREDMRPPTLISLLNGYHMVLFNLGLGSCYCLGYLGVRQRGRLSWNVC